MAQQQQVERVIRFPVSGFGGVNYRDQPDMLVPRSHIFDGQSWQQRPNVGLESPDLSDMDFFANGIGKRLGSVSSATIASVMVTNEIIIHYSEFRNPATGARVEIAIGKKSAYTNQSGSWAQLNYSSGLAYTHLADVTKVTTCELDGHLVVGLDGANYMMPYRTGSGFDDRMYNSTTTTTVNVTSNSGQKVLSVAATTMFNVGDRVRINSGGARDETGYIDSIVAGTSITLHSNLGFTHTNVQADVVQIANLYTNGYGSNATNAYNGTWSSGMFLVASCQARLCSCDGTPLINVTPPSNTTSSGIWDLASASSIATSLSATGRVLAMTNFTPTQQNQIYDYLWVNTPSGWIVYTGFGGTDIPSKGTGFGTLSYRSFAKARNWVIYMADTKSLRAFNGQNDIDIGQRLSNASLTGPLDGISLTDSATSAFGFYNPYKYQCFFFFNTGSTTFNDKCIVVDFKLGEPVVTDSQYEIEPQIRLLVWRMSSPTANPWWAHMAWTISGAKGILKTGLIYLTESGYSDLGTIIIQDYWFLPQLNGGDPVSGKEWLTLYPRFIPQGLWNVYVDYYFDRSSAATVTGKTFLQANPGSAVWDSAVWDSSIWTTDEQTKSNADIMAFKQVFQAKFYNQALGQSWIMPGLLIEYTPQALMR